MKLIYTGDFERLKEFGFEEEKTYYSYGYENRELWVSIDKTTKQIEMNEPFRDVDGEENNIVILYDLIQAGLVKKEEEDE